MKKPMPTGTRGAMPRPDIPMRGAMPAGMPPGGLPPGLPMRGAPQGMPPPGMALKKGGAVKKAAAPMKKAMGGAVKKDCSTKW